MRKQTRKPVQAAPTQAKKKPAKKVKKPNHVLGPATAVSQMEIGPEKLAPKRSVSSGSWMPAFLESLAENANVRLACLAAGVSRPAVYARRENDASFRAAWDTALEQACDILEEIARKRAREISDTLLIFLLKSHRPGIYRDTHRFELTGKDGKDLPTPIIYLPQNNREDE